MHFGVSPYGSYLVKYLRHVSIKHYNEHLYGESKDTNRFDMSDPEVQIQAQSYFEPV